MKYGANMLYGQLAVKGGEGTFYYGLSDGSNILVYSSRQMYIYKVLWKVQWKMNAAFDICNKDILQILLLFFPKPYSVTDLYSA